MMKESVLYPCAIGERNRDYYLEVFSYIDDGKFWKAMWNWAAFFFGPMWLGHRRLGVHYVFFSTVVCGLPILVVVEFMEYPVSIFFSIAIYCMFFPMSANLFLHYKIRRFIQENPDAMTEESLCEELQRRFRTQLDFIRNYG